MKKPITEKKLLRAVTQLNEIASTADPRSAMVGLTLLAGAYSVLLDTYALPNPQNPEGMCDDKAAFRKHFAQIIIEGGVTRRKAVSK